MTFNISHAFEQEQRIQNDLAAVEVQIEKETNFYCYGEFDGVTGGQPQQELWSDLNYRSGYLVGIGRYYDKKFNTVFNEPF